MAEQLIVTLDLMPEIIAALHKSVAEIVEQVAKDIADVYTGSAPRATGFMASSSYYVTKDTSTYGDLVGGEQDKAHQLLPEVAHPTSDQEAIAAVGATYAIFQELGTSKMPAQPAFHPAVETAQQEFVHEMSHLEKHIKP